MNSDVYSTKDTVPPASSGSGNITTSGVNFTLTVANDVAYGD
jgi:hypothetical protein